MKLLKIITLLVVFFYGADNIQAAEKCQNHKPTQTEIQQKQWNDYLQRQQINQLLHERRVAEQKRKNLQQNQ